MRKNLTQVVDAFLNGRSLSRDRSIHTDGNTIYSYALPIAKRVGNGFEVVSDDVSPSRTTTSHIRGVRFALEGVTQ